MATTYHHKPSSPLGRTVFVATPSFQGGPSGPYIYSLLKTIDEARKQDIAIHWCLLTGNCHVDDSRNYLVREFLETDCDDFFFIDADVGWQPEDFIKLVKSRHDVCAGIYPKKNDVTDYPVVFPEGDIQADENGWVLADKVPTGFLCFSRPAIQGLYDADDRKYNSQNEVGRLAQAIIFERTYVGNKRISGDYSACDKWRTLGGEIYIDPEMRFVHEGVKEWSGKLGHYLRDKNGLRYPYIAQIIQKVRKGDYTDADFFEIYEAYGNKWAAPPDLMAAWAMTLENTDGNVLEIGSGLTTLIASAIAERKGFKVVTIEHEEEWLGRVNELLSLCGLERHVTLAPIDNGWYDFTPEENFDLVLIDGPPREIGRQGVNNIQDHFNGGCVILVDDLDEDLGIRIDGLELKRYGRFGIGAKNNDLSQAS